ncbi:PTS sugar transporter subunit IIA, partial [Nocardioides sp. R-C-SC26]|uniref:PTS sugar transporter subunit IIA n=1 Tax=Nocardioides sp. R-C-SC26 TaxID=2870414 RepID=UPI001E5DB960
MTDLITGDLVRLDADLGADKDAVIGALTQVVAGAERTRQADLLLTDVMAREAKSSTGLPGGIAIPHCRTAAVSEPTLVFARLAEPVDFGAQGGGAGLVFLIAAPEGGGETHLQILTKLARALVKPDFTSALRAAAHPEDVVALVGATVGGAAPAAAGAGAPAAAAPTHPPDQRRAA